MLYVKFISVKIRKNTINVFLYLVGIVILLLFSFQVFILLLQLLGKVQLIDKIFNQLEQLVGYRL